MTSILKVDQLQDSGGNAIITSDGAGNLTAGTIPAKTIGTGAVLQVVYDTLDTNYGTSSSTFSDTGLTLNITPSSTSNKILIMFTGRLHQQNSGAEGQLKFLRDSTDIWTGYTLWGGSSATAANSAITIYDTPSTTAQITYKIQGALITGSPQFMILAAPGGGNNIATLTAMEISG